MSIFHRISSNFATPGTSTFGGGLNNIKKALSSLVSSCRPGLPMVLQRPAESLMANLHAASIVHAAVADQGLESLMREGESHEQLGRNKLAFDTFSRVFSGSQNLNGEGSVGQELLAAITRTAIGLVNDTVKSGYITSAVKTLTKAAELLDSEINLPGESSSGVAKQARQTLLNKTAAQLLNVNSAVFSEGDPNATNADIASDLGYIFSRHGIHDKAKEYQLQALNINENLAGRDDAISHVTQMLGKVCQDLGQYDQAEAHYNSSYEKTLESLGPNHRDTLDRQCNLGLFYLEKQDFSKAQEVLEECLGKERAQAGDSGSSLNLIRVLDNLADLHRQTGELDKAEEYGKHVYSARKDHQGENHTDTALSSVTLGAVYFRQEKYQDALPYVEKGLETLKQNLDQSDPTLAQVTLNLGKLHNKLGNQEEALALTRACSH